MVFRICFISNLSDHIRSRKETREQKTLVAKLMMEVKDLKETILQICDNVDHPNEKIDMLCSYHSEKGKPFKLIYCKLFLYNYQYFKVH